ncbi:hypothetical protein EZV62_012876 [Acer yangbiense]|uniref:F-box domain-containing protein n=1 Tax=Acer yangbiense TaxID=1000413 RepID=A0A5C7HWK7_9ROSI|nr:hypothetical protein EZV62_012876 [Acer yangbiense]
MEEQLPQYLIIEVLSRLSDSGDLARCRLVSRTFNSLCQEVRSINLVCTLSRYLKSRSPETGHLVTPFKTIFHNLVRNSRNLESVSVGVDKSLGGIAYDDVEDESDDLYLTDVGFFKDWLSRVCGDLKFLSISDFWIQSCWRKSTVFALISSCCHRLLELEVRNAWLSVDGLRPIPTLIHLTLEFVRLEDEDLMKINECFPSLQVLNLVGVGGLKDPKINLLHLKTCLWTASNAPVSLAIIAPKLVKLKLKCVKPKSLVLETPLLYDFHLSLEKANEVRLQEFRNLKNLQLESSSLGSLIHKFRSGNTVKRLKVNLLKSAETFKVSKFCLRTLLDIFPNVNSLTLCPRAWSEAETSFHEGGLESWSGMKEVKEFIAHLVVDDIDVTLPFIFCILNKCSNLSDMALLIHREVDSSIASNLISRCTADHPRIRWRWGMWKEGADDTWVSDGI